MFKKKKKSLKIAFYSSAMVTKFESKNLSKVTYEVQIDPPIFKS